MILGSGDEVGVAKAEVQRGSAHPPATDPSGTGRSEAELRQCAACGTKIHDKFLLKVKKKLL